MNVPQPRASFSSKVRSAARRGIMRLRRLRHGLAHVDQTFYMAANAQVCRDLVAAEYSYVGPECRLGPKVEIGPYAMLGPRVSIVGGDHRFDRPGVPIIFSGRPNLPTTTIESDAWIGAGATLLAGVRIGRGAIVAAGAVVTRDVSPYEIVGGVPARKIRDRFQTVSERAQHDDMLAQKPMAGNYCLPLEEAFPPSRRLRRLALTAGAILLFALGSEAALRVGWGFGHPLLLQKDSEIGYVYRANQHLRRFGNLVRINQHHQRSPAIQTTPALGTRRILLVGDSVAFGTTSLDQSETISERLRVELKLAGSESVEVLNASAGSWGLGNHLAYLKRFGTFGAELVVLQIGSHDLLQSKSVSNRVGVDPNMPDKPPALAWAEVWHRYLVPRLFGPKQAAAKSQGRESDLTAQFNLNMDYLDQAIRLSRSQGAKVVVLHTPNRAEVMAHLSSDNLIDYEPWRRSFVRHLETNQVPIVNLAARWKHGTKTSSYFLDEVHLTAAGSQAAARELSRELRGPATDVAHLTAEAAKNPAHPFPENHARH